LNSNNTFHRNIYLHCLITCFKQFPHLPLHRMIAAFFRGKLNIIQYQYVIKMA